MLCTPFSGQITHAHKLAEIRQCVADGAMEIDIVIPRTHALTGNWEALYQEVSLGGSPCCGCHLMTGSCISLLVEVDPVFHAVQVVDFREACGPAHMKTILATGELPTFTLVYQCSLICMMAGADFIKTSTGKEPTNATLAVSLVMCRAIREYHGRTGYKVHGGVVCVRFSNSMVPRWTLQGSYRDE